MALIVVEAAVDLDLNLNAVDPVVWIVAAVVLVVVVVLVTLLVAKRRRERAEVRQRLQQRFGPEYERTVKGARSRRAGEEELLAREKRRQSFTIRPVPPERRDDLRARWEEVQAGFIDAPNASLRKADELLDEAAKARGYPDASRDQRLADLSVDHPAAVERYCSARPEGDKDPSTEQLREGLLASRDLFEAMVSQGQAGSAESPPTPFQELVNEDEQTTAHKPTPDATAPLDASTRSDTHDAPPPSADDAPPPSDDAPPPATRTDADASEPEAAGEASARTDVDPTPDLPPPPAEPAAGDERTP